MPTEEKIPLFDSPDLRNPLTPLPELINIISGFLDVRSLSRLSRTCRKSWSLFKDLLPERALLQHVIRGEQKEAADFLDQMKKKNHKYWEIILKNTKGSEYCGRHWSRISALQFAAWAGDQFMMEMLLTHIPQSEQRALPLAQLQEVRHHQTQHGTILAPAQQLIACYEAYEKNFYRWSVMARNAYWVKQIGLAQQRLPMNILQVFCGNFSFAQQRPPSLVQDILLNKFDKPPHRTTMINEKQHLIPFIQDRNNKRAILRSTFNAAEVRECGPALELLVFELGILKQFCKIRLQNLDKQIEKLNPYKRKEFF